MPVGGSVYNGRIVACLQDDTYSYFQPGMQMTGTLRWGDITEDVAGHSGHIDRQWFPSYAGGGGTGGDIRGQAHNGTPSASTTVSTSACWRQFDRRNRQRAGAVHGDHGRLRRRHFPRMRRGSES